MKQIKLVVTQEMVNYLQRLSFEVQTREEIITKLLETHKDDIDGSLFTSKPFLKYSEELSRIKAEFELAKSEVENIYIPEVLRGKHKYNWNVDFMTNELTIDVLCECGIEAIADMK